MAKKNKKLNGDDILRKILRDDAESGKAIYQVLSDENPRYLHAKEGHVILFYEYAEAHGQIAALFDTLGFADYITEGCAELLDKFLATATAKKTDGSTAKLTGLLREADRLKLVHALARIAMRDFIHLLQPKLSHALQEHELEMGVLTRGLIEKFFSEFLTEVHSPDNARRDAARLVSMIKDDRRAWLAASLDHISGKPNFDRLKEHYDRLLPKWQRAKTVYESVGDLPNWREIISQTLEEEKPDIHLIARVSGRLNDLPDEIKAAVSEKGGDASPSSIAIEHAARLCGAKPYALHTRTLFRKMPKAADKQKVIKTKGVH